MKLFADLTNVASSGRMRRSVVFACGVAVFGGAGTLLVRAGDNPEMWRVVREFNRPLREHVQQYVPQQRLPEVFQGRLRHPIEVLSYAPVAPRFQPPARVTLPAVALPAERAASEPFSARQAEPRSNEPRTGEHRGHARKALIAKADGAGAPVAMNYCVRLCDGFAFPLGQAGAGTEAQEAACRATCPGAQTALYSAPAGAKDFDALTRAGRPYSALPSAFSYRDKLTATCTCNPVGASQSSAALLTDQTLRRGDLVMTRVGARHFDGSTRLPYRAGQFSDALARLTSRREITIVRAMEVASVRGLIPPGAPAEFRNRVTVEVQQAERIAAETRFVAAKGHPSGFVELQAREQRGPTPVPTVRRGPGLVALN